MLLISVSVLACSLSGTYAALVGTGIDMYKPPCAHSCSRAIESNMLSCSNHDQMSGDMDAMAQMTTPQCRAGDTAYLTTVAWCMSTKCASYHIRASELDKFWEEKITGDVTIAPKWDYATALKHVTQPPEREVKEEDTLDFTALVGEDAWHGQYQTLTFMEREERVHARYGIVILVVGFATPILLTCLTYLPYMTKVSERIRPYLVYTTTIGSYHVRSLPYLLGNAPTVGQALYIALMIVLNILLTAVNYKTTWPYVWYTTRPQEILSFIMYRTGILAFALAPLTLLFSSRNNVLLWLSNWSHSTYILLHRWIARIFGVQVILHSVLALGLYINAGTFHANQPLPYWIWGAVATVAVSIMLVASGLYVRRRSYEIFLATHIVLAILVLVGSWYHVDIRFERQFGYEMWLYAAFAVWFFDRLVRVMRVLKTGLRRARVTDIGGGFVRVDVEGIRWSAVPGRHVYAYFPGLNPLRPWENHPFSVVPTALLGSEKHSVSSSDSDSARDSDRADLEKSEGAVTQTSELRDKRSTSGLTLFIRKSKGMTKSLKNHESMLTLLDGPYPNNHHGAVLQYDRLLLLGGGIGITGLLPWVSSHPNVKLCWSVKETGQCLVQAMDSALSGVSETDVRVGRRLDIEELLYQEVRSGWVKIGIVACGPARFCDDVRSLVAVAGTREKTVLELQVDAYSW